MAASGLVIGFNNSGIYTTVQGVRILGKRIYSLERPEEVYDLEPAVPEDTAEELLEGIRHPKIAGYRIKTQRAGRYAEAKVYPFWRCSRDVPRRPRRDESSEKQKAMNDKYAGERIVNVVQENFGSGDIWMTLDYTDEHLPADFAGAQKRIRWFLDWCKREARRRGVQAFKYLYTTEGVPDAESPTGVRYHHHVFLTRGIDRDVLEEKWRFGERTQSKRLVEDKDGLAGIAVYTGKTRRRGQRRWSGSLNLKKPPRPTVANHRTTKKQVLDAACGMRELWAYFEKLYPEWEITQVEHPAYNEINGGVYLHARMRRRQRAGAS